MTVTTTAATLEVAAAGRDRWLVPSRSKPGTFHIVIRHKGRLSCDCLGDLYAGRCAHASAVQAKIDKPANELTADMLALGLSLIMGKA